MLMSVMVGVPCLKNSQNITKIGPNWSNGPCSVFPFHPQLNDKKGPEKVVTPVTDIGHMFSTQVVHSRQLHVLVVDIKTEEK